MLYILILYIFIAMGLFFVPEKFKKNNPFFIAILQLGAFIFFLSQVPTIKSGEPVTRFINWIPLLNLNFEFALDGLSLIFALLITGIGTLIFVYARVYMKSYSYTRRFYFYLTAFSAVMLGLVLSVNFIQLFIFWELTSILSFLLISFFNEKEKARKAAFQSLFITAFGGLSLLGGIILIGSITDSYSFNTWLENADLIRSDKKYLVSLILILVGVFTKSAQFPFHFWLPGAMQAPTPVSAYLHSATMVKAGVFLLARLNPVLGGTTEWIYIITVVGASTMLVGAYLSITQTDIKAILAYTTISALGILVLLFGIDTKLSIKAALVFLFVHAFYKASLFMIAGYIDKKTGTRDIDKLGGIIRYAPIGFVVVLIAALSMAGLPPMLGFIGKELIYEAKVQSPGIASLILILGVASNILMVTISLFFTYKIFLGKGKVYKNFDNDQFLFLFGPGVLAILSLGFGIFPNYLSMLIEPAINVIGFGNAQIKLKLWHGFNNVFFLSVFTVLLGSLIFFLLKKGILEISKWRTLNNKLFGVDFSELFANLLDWLVKISAMNTKLIQHGYHRFYMLTVIVFTTILLWVQIYITKGWGVNTIFSLKPVYITGLVLVSVISIFYSVTSKSRIATVIAMSVIGYGISLIYLYYSAVDLAITQIIIETLIVVMIVLVLQKAPKFANLSTKLTRLRDAFIALSFGTVMTVLAIKAINVEFNHPISDFFISNSLIQAYGKNVVNVILVDFRALDTLGEVTVLTIAAIGVSILLKQKNNKSALNHNKK